MTLKLVKCRKEHTCYICNRKINSGEYTIRESGSKNGVSLSSYTCRNCIEQYCKERGLIEEKNE